MFPERDIFEPQRQEVRQATIQVSLRIRSIIGLDKSEYQVNSFLITRQKHMLWVLIRRYILVEMAPYQELCSLIIIFTGQTCIAKDAKCLHAENENTDQTARTRRTRGYKTFFMLNWAEHEIFHANES